MKFFVSAILFITKFCANEVSAVSAGLTSHETFRIVRERHARVHPKQFRVFLLIREEIIKLIIILLFSSHSSLVSISMRWRQLCIQWRSFHIKLAATLAGRRPGSSARIPPEILISFNYLIAVEIYSVGAQFQQPKCKTQFSHPRRRISNARRFLPSLYWVQ